MTPRDTTRQNLTQFIAARLRGAGIEAEVVDGRVRTRGPVPPTLAAEIRRLAAAAAVLGADVAAELDAERAAVLSDLIAEMDELSEGDRLPAGCPDGFEVLAALRGALAAGRLAELAAALVAASADADHLELGRLVAGPREVAS